MNRKILILTGKVVILSFLLLFISCSAVKVVSTNSTDDFKLTNYKTFDIYRLDVESPMHPEYKQRMEWIRDAVTEYMEGRGLSYSFENPELIINIGIVIKEVEETILASNENQSIFIQEQNYQNPFGEEVIDRYDEETVTIDFVDLERNTLVWRGVVQAIMAPTEEGSRDNIADGVKKISDRIP